MKEREVVSHPGALDLSGALPTQGQPKSIAASHRLDPLLRPDSLAFVGASVRPDTPGNTMVRAVAMDGYAGSVYAINPKYDSVEGVPCFASLADLPQAVEHVVLGVANEHLEAELAAAIRHGARAATIFASCVLEGDDRLADRLSAMAREAGMAICGGNGMGFCNPTVGLRVSGYATKGRMLPGGVTLIAQSGSAFSALGYNDRRLKFNLCASTGRELATATADYMDWALEQGATRVIGLFLESARDPAAFVAALAKAETRRIPVVVLKVGRTETSAAFAASHSGAIAGDDAAYEALFEKWGVQSVGTLDSLAASLLLFGNAKPAAAGGMASVHDSGGEREMVVDLASEIGVPLAAISTATKARLRRHLDPELEPVNPLDVWGTGRDFEANVEACLSALLDDPDTAIGVMFEDIRDGSYITKGFTAAAIRAAGNSDKPVALVTNYASLNHRDVALATTEAGVPVIDGTEEGLRAVRNLLAFRDHLPVSPSTEGGVDEALRAAWRARLASGTPLDEAEGLRLIADYGIATPSTRIAETREAALAAAREIGFPVVLKTAAPGVLHKSDRDGVRLGIADEAGLAAAYDDMAARLGPRILVATMAGKGVEIGLGIVNDHQFGPYLIVAAGGIWIEILKDRVVAIPPVSTVRAATLVDRLRIRPLLDGRRGLPPADLPALHHAISRLSALAEDLGDLIAEMDINPVIVSNSGAVAVDAVVVPRRAPDAVS
jgi:acyl-CoA synthetase (NDP forming)